MLQTFLPVIFSAVDAQCNKGSFFGFPRWYKYLDVQYITVGDSKSCQVVDFKFPDDIMLILLAVLDILLRLGGLVALGFMIYGAIQYLTSQGEPDAAKKAQSTIINALIGMVICIFAASIVAFIGNRLG
jgi:ABC-type Fe3+ transport system permease subunit